MKPGLKARLEAIPHRPGVYTFRDSDGKAIYVGKAKSLRNRVSTYFQAPAEYDVKGETLRQEIADLEITVCDNEIDALILEASLIKKYRPRFNVNLRDDKSYPYIAVTLSDVYPRAALMRGKRARGIRYYGPYVNAKAAKNTLRLLQKVFPLRHCPGAEPGRPRQSQCLYHQMDMCLGPCTGEVDPEEYGKVVKSFCDFLEGRYQSVIKDLNHRMLSASQKQEYEEAAKIRNQLESANKVLSHKRSLSSSMIDYDVIGLHYDEMTACFTVAQNRGGIHLGNLCYFTDLEQERPENELVTEFIKRYYDQAGSIPKQILVTTRPDEVEGLDEWLSSEKSSRVIIKVPQRGRKKKELSLANANARLAHEGARIERARDKARVRTALAELARELELDRFPLRIECYDISTMGGTASVGSMVTFQDGLPDRRHYRKFSIKFTPGIDDVGMMKEVLYRRFKRYLKGKREDGEGSSRDERTGFELKPDLILLDGGKGQLTAGIEVLKVLGIDDIEVASLAKKLEEVFRPGHRDSIIIPRDSEALFLLQRLRDEAHRVAVDYHRSLMLRSTGSSWLDNVAGVGPARKKSLIKHIGSPRLISEASIDEIRAVPGIPAPVADAVFEAAKRTREADS